MEDKKKQKLNTKFVCKPDSKSIVEMNRLKKRKEMNEIRREYRSFHVVPLQWLEKKIVTKDKREEMKR